MVQDWLIPLCVCVCADCVTPSYLPLRQTDVVDRGRLVSEVEEFVPSKAKSSQPFTTYNNHLYVLIQQYLCTECESDDEIIGSLNASGHKTHLKCMTIRGDKR